MEDNHAGRACPQFEALLEDLLDDGLETAEKERVLRHVQECAGCSGAFESAAQVSKFLRHSLSVDGESPDAAFGRRAMAAIRIEEEEIAEENSFWRPMQVLAWRLAASAALAVALLFAYARFLPAPPPPAMQIIAQQTSDLELIPDPAHHPINGEEVLLMGSEFNYGK
jgi:hypothetical protein